MAFPMVSLFFRGSIDMFLRFSNGFPMVFPEQKDCFTAGDVGDAEGPGTRRVRDTQLRDSPDLWR